MRRNISQACRHAQTTRVQSSVNFFCADFHAEIYSISGAVDRELVHRLAYNGDVAAGQLAVFQGASEAPISEFIRVERATQKNGQPAAARRVALKMGRRLRCSSVRIDSDMRPPSASPARTALPAAHFERNEVTIICETVH